MAKQELTNQTGLPTRRKFVWGLGIATAFAAVGTFTGIPLFNKKRKGTTPAGNKNRTVKMLTQDGKLVEVDEALLTANRRKVTNAELQQWIKK